MTERTPLEGWDQQTRRQLTHEVVANGWMRHLPPAASLLLFAAEFMPEPPTLEDLRRILSSPEHPDGSWDGLARDLPTVYTDDKLAELDEDFPEWVDPDAPAQTAAEVNAEEQAQYDEQIARDDRYAAHYGLPPLRTCRDALNLLLAAQLLFAVEENGATRYRPAWPLPLVQDVFPLAQEDKDAEDSMRWSALHETTSQRLIELFAPDSDDPLTQLSTSLERLAEHLAVDAESIREGITVLLAVGDFSTSVDVTRVPATETFELVVDWEAFARKRISIRLE